METKIPSTATNPRSRPKFRGDKKRLIGLIDGKRGVVYPDKLIPFCYSDPNLESGVCNPLLPLRDGEPHLCALYKSCLAAKLLSEGVAVNYMEARDRPYEEILADADQLFDRPSDDTDATNQTEILDRNTIRAHALSITLQPPPNPFRRNSLRRSVLDILSRDWVSLNDLKAILLTKKGEIRRADLVISQVTSLSTQETSGYRIVESMGRYKAFRR